ncbi:MAG TPA: NADP-dependent oxidoreductase [Pseudonocardia sp.]|jgi:NADPH:quinone reductase-like Zn-dependent oxidoreductase|nr:NADP-dependent oxidoreductase [Pseudonocardia sp.]
MKAVRYERFGGADVLEVRDVETPSPGPGEVLVEVRAAGINPGEALLRSGALAEMFPSTFPSGQGSDLAGVVAALGDGVGDRAVGDEVIGWVDTRSSHAEIAVVPSEQLIAKPRQLAWETVGGLFVAGTTARAAVRAVALRPGEVVVVSGAAGGVGCLTVQLALEAGATVLGIAGAANHPWLGEHGVTPIDYADGLDAVAARITTLAPNGVDAFIDTFGHGYVDLAVRIGIRADRINTIIDFDAVQRHAVRMEGNAQGASTDDLSELATRLVEGRLELPVAASYPLREVRAAFEELERRHTRGKIVLIP